MKLCIFGASGGVGRELVEQAGQAGHQVRAVVRDGSSIAVKGDIEVVSVSNVTSVDVIGRAVAGCDAVLSALGLRRSNPNNPWSRVVSPVDLTSRFARALVDSLLRENPSARVIVVSAAGVADSRPHMNAVLRWMFDHSNIGIAYADLAKMEAVLQSSPLDWTAVRPVTLTNGKPTDRVKVIEHYGLFSKIRRADVAAWMLEQLSAPARPTRTPMIANG